jgi:hypothetical protein
MYNWYSLWIVSRERESELLARSTRVRRLRRADRVPRSIPRGLLGLRVGAALCSLGEAVEGTGRISRDAGRDRA